MIIIAKNCNESRFRLFWDALQRCQHIRFVRNLLRTSGPNYVITVIALFITVCKDITDKTKQNKTNKNDVAVLKSL